MTNRNKNDASDQIGGLSGTVTITEATTLTTANDVVIVGADTAMTITLPPCAAMKGRSIHIVPSITIAELIYISDQDDSLGWSDITVQTNDTWVLESNGVSWARIKGDLTS